MVVKLLFSTQNHGENVEAQNNRLRENMNANRFNSKESCQRKWNKGDLRSKKE